ncbi:MAG TPA: glycogen debranching protein GlgX [Eoetvoesiella sp.]
MRNAFHDRLDPGLPYPLGATSDGLGVNFAVFSANASRIELCLFDARGRKELHRLALPECTDEIWHGYLPNCDPGIVYGYRAYGPYDPAHGHRFNPHKLLLDPYARQIQGSAHWSDTLFGYRVGHPKADLSLDRRDNAANVPKGIVTDESFQWGAQNRPHTAWSDTTIYEAHIRGVSMRREDLPAEQRGTCSALADPRFIDHLHTLGVRAIELMPVHAFLRDQFLVQRGLTNYWGYNTLSFFAPEPAYLLGGKSNDLRIAIRRLHAAGIEVILDVVYNHTCEGSELGPTLSWRGLDNASYYRLIPGDERHYINDTGCGNTVNLSHPRVLQMVMDSLRYWAKSYRVDGFRFDLGVTLGREGTGFDPGSGFFDAIAQDPDLSRLKLISEPWDIGPDGYQLGNHPPGFSEWNDKFRDTTRRYWRGDPGLRGEMASRLMGSSELFNRRHRRPWASVNYIASHDGLTAFDVASYQNKHNDANGDENKDGHDENFSRNWGVEGPTDQAAINAVRLRVLRAMLATVFFSHGTPMLLAGDEFGNSQQGNNNAYCQDNEMSWLDWTQAAEEPGRSLIELVSRLTALRRQHRTLRMSRYMNGQKELISGLPAVTWFDAGGEPMTDAGWHNPEDRVLGLRRAHQEEGGSVEVTLLLLNSTEKDVPFTLPPSPPGWNWLLNTAAPRHSGPVPGNKPVICSAHSVILLGCTLHGEA